MAFNAAFIYYNFIEKYNIVLLKIVMYFVTDNTHVRRPFSRNLLGGESLNESLRPFP